MFARIKSLFTVADLRNKVLFTLFIFAIYRVGVSLRAPGVDAQAVSQLREASQSQGALGFLNLFSGGAFGSFSIFALGIMPYITASIIMQVLTVVIPKLEQWQQEGATGQRKITQWTRYVAVAIATLQAAGLTFIFGQGNGSAFFGAAATVPDVVLLDPFMPRALIVIPTLVAGTTMLMWMGELISQRGIGNGMSLLIFASVVSSLPALFGRVYAERGFGALAFTIAAFVALLVAIVFVEQGQRRIPVQFAKRVVGRKMYGGQSTYIPLKVNQSGVIPIIFASSVLYLPQLLVVLLPSDQDWAKSVQSWIDENLANPLSPVYIVVFGLMIVGFAYFYTAITFDPAKQADTLRKQGGFIPGYRPGPATERYLAKVLSRITLPGALFIAAVALVPTILLGVFVPGSQNAFGGTTVLIAVGVALETMKQIDSQLMMRNYEGFLK